MATHVEDFAALLRELKDRSGRSYGQLAARLHVSTSTLHRYCNGAAVPTDYAPVERLARLCGATPDELVTLHRRWLLADAARREPDRAGPVAEKPDPAPVTIAPNTAPAATPLETHGTPHGAVDALPDATPVDAPDTLAAPGPQRTRPRRAALVLGAVAAVAAVAAIPLLLHGSDATQDVGASSPAPGHGATTGSSLAVAPASPTGSASTSATAPSPSASASASATGGASTPAAPTLGGPTPFQVNVLADNWDTECDQWFLMNQQPGKVPPPPSLEQSGAWASALGGIPAGDLRLQLTAQGLSSQTVVLHAAYIHVISRKPAPKGIAYTTGSGCGGGLDPASFAVNLDQPVPATSPVAGTVGGGETVQLQKFPFQISATDPQVLNVDASTLGQDVSWYLELVWSSGGHEGKYVVNDHGRPFRTVGLRGDQGYFYNGSAWAVTPIYP